MDRDETRVVLAKAGITTDNVTDAELKRLRLIISKHLKASGFYKGSASLTRAKMNLKFIEMKTNQWDRREAVSFNSDGFIGVAGWADSTNVKPLLAALFEWSQSYGQLA